MDSLAALNFRDVGGCSVSGGRMRRGVVYRSQGPGNLTEAHRLALTHHQFRLVCDLRSNAERTRHPNEWVAKSRLLNIDILADLRDRSNDGWRVLSAKPSAEGAREAMIGNYRTMPTAFHPHVANLIDALIAGETPALIHCTAGKDRTGVLVALLLKLLGASDDEILRDYLLSERFARAAGSADVVGKTFSKVLGYSLDDSTLAPIIGVDPAYLQAAFDGVAARWGSVENYFVAAGIGERKRAALTTCLVDTD